MRDRLQAGSVLVSAVVCLALLFAVQVNRAADGNAVAWAIEVTGRVSVERSNALWVVAGNGSIQPGEFVVTGPDGHALFQLDDGSKFEVFPDSRVQFRANPGSWRDLLDIYLGKVKVHIQKLGGRPNPYRVNSATALIAVRGTIFEVAVESDATTIIAVEEGVVGVYHKRLPSQHEVLLKSGEVLTVRPTEPIVPESIGKARAAARIIRMAVDSALQTVRGPAGRAPVPGGAPTPGGGTGPTVNPGDMGQAPGPKDPGDGDSGPGVGPGLPGSGTSPTPAPTPGAGGSAPPPTKNPPPRSPSPKGASGK